MWQTHSGHHIERENSEGIPVSLEQGEVAHFYYFYLA